MTRKIKPFRAYLLFALLYLTGTSVFAARQQVLRLHDGIEISADVYGPAGLTRILWIAPSYGIHPRHQQVAEDLGKLGFEVWQVDLADALFLPRGANTMRQIPPAIVTQLIQQLIVDNHRLLIISGSYGSIPALRGVQQWQSQKPVAASVIGIMLFSPYLYTQVPPLGQAPDFIPMQTSVPIYIFQAEKNGNRWHFPAQLAHMQEHATVYSEIMPGVTSMFYDEDSAGATKIALSNIAKHIKQRIPLLAKHIYPLSAPGVTSDATPRLGLDEKLKPYHGKIQPIPFDLKDVHGKTYRRHKFKDKVTIINFWASWCPPCVEEIPSLNRLREKMQGQNFELISINYAESPDKIKNFMQQVAVDFPVLVDPEGKTAGKWKVVAFPSTFVIGPDGQIHYGVNAAILWDTHEVIQQLKSLL